MSKININVKVVGDYPMISQYLEEVKVFNNEIHEDTISILIGTTKELKNEKFNENTICFTDKDIKCAHMKCTYLETQVISALNTILFLIVDTGTINFDLEEIKNVLKCNEFYIISASDETLIEAMELTLNSIEGFKLFDIKNVIVNFIIDKDETLKSINEVLDLLRSKIPTNCNVLFGSKIANDFNEKHVQLILSK